MTIARLSTWNMPICLRTYVCVAHVSDMHVWTDQPGTIACTAAWTDQSQRRACLPDFVMTFTRRPHAFIRASARKPMVARQGATAQTNTRNNGFMHHHHHLNYLFISFCLEGFLIYCYLEGSFSCLTQGGVESLLSQFQHIARAHDGRRQRIATRPVDFYWN